MAVTAEDIQVGRSYRGPGGEERRVTAMTDDTVSYEVMDPKAPEQAGSAARIPLSQFAAEAAKAVSGTEPARGTPSQAEGEGEDHGPDAPRATPSQAEGEA